MLQMNITRYIHHFSEIDMSLTHKFAENSSKLTPAFYEIHIPKIYRVPSVQNKRVETEIIPRADEWKMIVRVITAPSASHKNRRAPVMVSMVNLHSMAK